MLKVEGHVIYLFKRDIKQAIFWKAKHQSRTIRQENDFPYEVEWPVNVPFINGYGRENSQVYIY